MYIYIMHRTQIYLSEDQASNLNRLSAASGRSKSDLIRQAIDDRYPSVVDRQDFLSALAETAGSWKGRKFTGAEYVDGVRPGRLNKLYAKQPK